MAQQRYIQPKEGHAVPIRDEDPNIPQQRASDPDVSVWVNASAGTGKTKVLTDRVLRLLLPGPHSVNGARAERILCLTYTKAAASEMALRINKTLAEWAIAAPEVLKEKLKNLTGADPDRGQMEKARTLFSSTVDAPDGLKIMTIHSFCQYVLKRFPVEAGITPDFQILDEEEAEKLLKNAMESVFAKYTSAKASATQKEVFERLATALDAEKMKDLLANIMSERLQMSDFIGGQDKGEAEEEIFSSLYRRLCDTFGLPFDLEESDILEEMCSPLDEQRLKRLGTALENGTKTDQARGQIILEWLSCAQNERLEMLEAYKKQFLTKEEKIREKITKGALEFDPEATEILCAEAQRLSELIDKQKAQAICHFTASLFLLANDILSEYMFEKAKTGALDYDDQILKTKTLLSDHQKKWVLFKLDGGLDHLLIDEAQDTNPEQWEIISALTDDFYDQSGSVNENRRTLFVVGDQKQSIYSFQRAAPEKFTSMRDFFKEKALQYKQNFRSETLLSSFRSTPSVLEYVDSVFARPETLQGLGQDTIMHRSNRKGEAGHVALWPLIESEAAPEEEPWTLPIEIQEESDSKSILCENITSKIKNWLDQGTILESRGDAIKPDDILILFRTRTSFMLQMIKSLKNKGILVNGIDRLVLNDEIAVQDLLAAANFALLPCDDLTLACLLKTPFIGMNEETLFELCHQREGSLWQAVQKEASSDIVYYLKDLITRAKTEDPFLFFSKILLNPCPGGDPGDKMSGLRAMQKRLGRDCLDAMDEFLNTSLNASHQQGQDLQSFCFQQMRNHKSVKREQEAANGSVRVMTVHGSKGLQAPIVFLPDTIRVAASKKTPKLLWPDKTGMKIPLWSPNKNFNSDLFQRAQKKVEERLDEEYRRLLYVALTRAEDMLFIGGCTGKKNSFISESWYNYCQNGFETLGVEESADGTKYLSNPQTKETPEIKNIQAQEEEKAMPEWLFEKPARSSDHIGFLQPSKIGDEGSFSISPAKGQENKRFKRGTVIHKLFEYLPATPKDLWRERASFYLRKEIPDMPDDLLQKTVDEVLNVLEDPEFQFIFQKRARAEVPLSGLLDGKMVSAQIDRLLIEENKIWILDYKTNKPPPVSEKDVPEVYKRQMHAYAALIRSIYPRHQIKAAILWTDVPKLMEIRLMEIGV